MQGKYILLALVVILIAFPPAGASLNKITAGAPVFIGESNLDITRALDNCRIIAWWPEGADTSGPAAKNITLHPVNEISETISHYTISPAEYARYTGKWYCEEWQPHRLVFEVVQPRVSIHVWDMANDKDLSGTTVPATANFTYRIDTNLDLAMQLKYRPDRSPADLFYTVKLTSPSGKGITNIYTGNFGSAGTAILLFDSTPLVLSAPYYWKSGSAWNLTSRNMQGDLLYPSGTYLFSLNQNLNGMQDTYKTAGIMDTEGKLTSSANITIVQPRMIIPTPASVQPVETTPISSAAETPLPAPATLTPKPTTPVPVKTTYSPVPAGIVLAGLCAAAAFAIWQRK
jgi:hypothetical protein